MVFCYKYITDSPRRSTCTSPRKRYSPRKLSNFPNAKPELHISLEYTKTNSAIDSIPEREWRLLAALARKREESEERENLADQFRKMWQKEKEERKVVEAETSDQYKRYLDRKRKEERWLMECKKLERSAHHQLKKSQVMDCIRYKERRSADVLALIDDIRVSQMIDKAFEEEVRAQLAADKRTRIDMADEWRRQVEFADAQKRADDAERKRKALLRDVSQRVAISNALNSWETTLLRTDILALDALKRSQHAANAALTRAKSIRLAKARESRVRRARKMAAITAQMREVIKYGR